MLLARYTIIIVIVELIIDYTLLEGTVICWGCSIMLQLQDYWQF